MPGHAALRPGVPLRFAALPFAATLGSIPKAERGALPDGTPAAKLLTKVEARGALLADLSGPFDPSCVEYEGRGSLEASPKARRPLLFSLLWKD
jgi:hypothetical protein